VTLLDHFGQAVSIPTLARVLYPALPETAWTTEHLAHAVVRLKAQFFDLRQRLAAFELTIVVAHEGGYRLVRRLTPPPDRS
jgi:hypothetical protein